MDAIVEAALKKWPDVPACHGWLALDARGHWYMRDDAVRRAGPFPRVKGSRIEHERLKAFIARNYDRDPLGQWYFQNGPQRVYVELEAAPWVFGLQWLEGRLRIESHTGLTVDAVRRCWLDEHGRVFLATNLGLGIVRSADMLELANAVDAGVFAPEQGEHAAILACSGDILHPGD